MTGWQAGAAGAGDTFSSAQNSRVFQRHAVDRLRYGIARLFLMVVLVACTTGSCRTVDESTSLAHPDIWDWTAPKIPGKSLTELHTSLLDNDDVLVSSSYKAPDGRIERRLTTMFLRQTINETRSDLASGQVVLADGVVRRVVARESASVVLQDGDRVTVSPHVYRQCYRGPARYTLARLDSLGHYELEKAAFYLLDEPKEFIGGGGDRWFEEFDGSCPNEPPLRLKYQVEALSGMFLALPDGTLLMALQGYPTVLRLTSDLETRSLLNNRRIFLFPFDARDDPLFVGKLTGKNYGSIEAGTARYQEALDDLYAYLLKIRGRK